MLKLSKIQTRAGMPPGSIIPDEEHSGDVRIRLFDYNETELIEKEITVDECYVYRDKPTVTWINIDGLNAEIIQQIGEHFDVHLLNLEDILDASQRPKIEDHTNYTLVVLKMIYYDVNKNELIIEHVSLIFGQNFVLSFQEEGEDVFEPIRERLRLHKGRVRSMGADYLAYCLIDAIVDNYYVVMEEIGDDIEDIEERTIDKADQKIPQMIQQLKRQVLYLRKSVWPLREVITGMQKTDASFIQQSTRIYLRDAYDHVIQISDTIETYRDLLTTTLDIYMSSVNNKMSEVMKALAIFSAIFLPLTFITGFYGMNFVYIPLLQSHIGYLITGGIMLLVVIVMLTFFKIRKWF